MKRRNLEPGRPLPSKSPLPAHNTQASWRRAAPQACYGSTHPVLLGRDMSAPLKVQQPSPDCWRFALSVKLRFSVWNHCVSAAQLWHSPNEAVGGDLQRLHTSEWPAGLARR